MRGRKPAAAKPAAAKTGPKGRPPTKTPASSSPVAAVVAPSALPVLERLPADISLVVDFDLSDLEPLLAAGTGRAESAGGRPTWAWPRASTMLCLPHLRGIETFRYRTETVRKVLKQFHGRVLLADEVGLGKTVEASMVLKAYLLRGMVERVLVLVPASLVGRWREELETKFDIPCATTYDPLLRDDPERFWAAPRIVASLALARRREHAERLLGHALDLPNAVWRFQGQQAAWTRCPILAFRTTALSDEKRESLLWLGFNTGTGAALGEVLPRLRATFAGLPWQAPEAAVRQAAGSGWDAAALAARVRPVLDAAVRIELAPFLRAMQRRLARDHARPHGYHDDLRRDSLKRLAALEGTEGTKAEADRGRGHPQPALPGLQQRLPAGRAGRRTADG